jgi:hypothetical protein
MAWTRIKSSSTRAPSMPLPLTPRTSCTFHKTCTQASKGSTLKWEVKGSFPRPCKAAASTAANAALATIKVNQDHHRCSLVATMARLKALLDQSEAWPALWATTKVSNSHQAMEDLRLARTAADTVAKEEENQAVDTRRPPCQVVPPRRTATTILDEVEDKTTMASLPRRNHTIKAHLNLHPLLPPFSAAATCSTPLNDFYISSLSLNLSFFRVFLLPLF